MGAFGSYKWEAEANYNSTMILCTNQESQPFTIANLNLNLPMVLENVWHGIADGHQASVKQHYTWQRWLHCLPLRRPQLIGQIRHTLNGEQQRKSQDTDICPSIIGTVKEARAREETKGEITLQ